MYLLITFITTKNIDTNAFELQKSLKNMSLEDSTVVSKENFYFSLYKRFGIF